MLECKTLLNYIQILNSFLKSFPTTLAEDNKIDTSSNIRKHMAVVYRKEMKKLVRMQISLAMIAHNILQRINCGIGFGMACERVSDLEGEHGMLLIRCYYE